MVSIEKTFKLRSINYCNNGPAEGCYAGYRSPRVGETQRKDFFLSNLKFISELIEPVI